jgi:pimeloyl-ACP methyl ester carboxylesterase
MKAECQTSLACFTVGEKCLEVLLCEPPFAQHTIVLLHEALGSVSYWKDFPDKLSVATGCRVLAYSRAGHGNSQGPLEPRSPEYYRNQVETVLPALLDHFEVGRPVLYGHSEGAAIGLLYAAQAPDSVHALILEAPVVAPEPSAREKIQDLAETYASSGLQSKLTRYHRDADAVFQSWIAGVTAPQMLEFPVELSLPKVVCPVLVLQGAEDEFGGPVQLHVLRKYLPWAQWEVIAGAGHLLHREQTEFVLNRVRQFLAVISSVSQERKTFRRTQVP